MADNQLMPADFNYDALVRFRNDRSTIHQWRHRNGKIKAAYRGAQLLFPALFQQPFLIPVHLTGVHFSRIETDVQDKVGR